MAIGVLLAVLIVIVFFLYAKAPSFKFGGSFKEEIIRQRREREQHLRDIGERDDTDAADKK